MTNRILRSLAAATATALTAALLAASPAPALPGWTAESTISTAHDLWAPQLAAADDGSVTAVWIAQSSGGAPATMTATRPPGGSWSPPTSLSGGSFASWPDLAVNGRGDAVAIWSSTVFPNFTVHAAYRPAGGSWRGIGGIGGTGDSAQVAIDPQGRATIVWHEDTWVEARTYDGSAWGPATTISHPHRGGAEPRLAVDASGNVTAVWTGVDSSAGHSVVDSAYRPVGGPWQPAVKVSGVLAAFDADIAVDATGTATAVFVKVLAPSGKHVAAKSTRRNGAWGTQHMLELHGQAGVASPRVVQAGGFVAAAWLSHDGAGPDYSLEANTWFDDDTGEVLDNAKAVTVSGTRRFDLESSRGGGAALAYDTDSGAGTALRTSDGGSWRAHPQLGASGVEDPATTVDAAGDVTTAWPDHNHLIDSTTLLFKTWDVSAPTLTPLSFPTSGTAGTPLTFSAAALDTWSGATVEWRWGDNGAVNQPGATLQHTYASPGTYPVMALAKDGFGNVTLIQRSVTITGTAVGATPPPAPAPGGAAAPAVTSMTLSRGTITVDGPRRTRRTKLSLRLSTPASVKVTVTRTGPGRRAFSWSTRLPAGTTRTTLSSRLGGTRLPVGRYVVRAVAGNTGGAGAARSVRMKVVRR